MWLRLSLVVILVFISAVSNCFGVELVPATSGKWKGHPIGTYILTKITEEDSRTGESSTEWTRRLLLGQDAAERIYVLRGKADENGEFIEEPRRDIARSNIISDRVIDSKTHTWKRNGITFEVEVERHKQPTFLIFQSYEYTLTKLKKQPDFVLELYHEEKDEFRGLKYHSLHERKLISVRREERFGKEILVFDTEATWTIDGIVRSKSMSRLSPDMPGLLYSKSRSFGEDGSLNEVTTHKLVEIDLSPDDVVGHNKPLAAQRHESLPIDSDFEQWRIENAMARGYSRQAAIELVKGTPTSKKGYDSGYFRAFLDVNSVWAKFVAEPDSTNRLMLIDTLAEQAKDQHLSPFRGPKAEALANEMYSYTDEKIKFRAAVLLCNMASARYSDTLEEVMIEQQQLDAEGLAALFQTGLAPMHHIANVLHEVNEPLDNLPLAYLGYAPKERAVEELVSRLHKDKDKGGYNRDEYLKILSSFDSDRVRVLVHNLAKEITEDHFSYGAITKSAGVLDVIEAACVLRVEGIDEMFRKWIGWFWKAAQTLGKGPVADTDQMSFAFIFPVTFIEHGLGLYRPEINDTLRTMIKQLPPQNLFVILRGASKYQGTEILSRLQLDLTMSEIRDILGVPAWTPFGETNALALAPHVMAYLSDSDHKERLDLVLEKVLPDYDQRMDLHSAWLESNRYWYLHRTGKKRFHLSRSGDRWDEFIASLYRYGKPGRQTVRHLYQWPPLRESLYCAIRTFEEDRDYWTSKVRADKCDTEAEEFERGLTLWCLGDLTLSNEYDPLLLDRTAKARTYKLYRALAYLPESELLRIVRKHKDQFEPYHWFMVAQALSRHKSTESALLMIEAWEQQLGANGRISVAHVVNRAAGSNFGMRKKEAARWAQSLSIH
ncbi:MAG: hypothetical protein ACYTEL_23700 [Planctomycetota bacterium]|jgi:hypothetical protein